LKRIKTKFSGVYYRETITNGKPDKVYYIVYKDRHNKTVEQKIGKFSEGIREIYCHNKRNEIITKLRLGEIPPTISKNKRREKIDIDDIAQEYFKTRHNQDSLKKDMSVYNKYIKENFLDIETITKRDIINYIHNLKKVKSIKGTNLSEKTINNILTLLTTIINYGLKNNLIKNDITKHIKKLPINNERERFLTKEEIQELYDTLLLHNKTDLYIFCKIALNTGARLSTITAIKKKDIDFNHKIINLNFPLSNLNFLSSIKVGFH